MCNVGKRIRDRRIELGFSAEELAPMVGLSPATIYRYENGDIKKVSINKVRPIAAALKTTESYLMGWTDNAEIAEEVTEVVTESALSARAMEVAKIYDKLDQRGKDAVDAILKIESEYSGRRRSGETRLLRSIPVIEGVHDSVLQARYNSKMEQKELAQEEVNSENGNA